MSDNSAFEKVVDEVFAGVVNNQPKQPLNTVILTRHAMFPKVMNDPMELIGIHHFMPSFLTMKMIQSFDNIIFIDQDEILVMKGRRTMYGRYPLTALTEILAL